MGAFTTTSTVIVVGSAVFIGLLFGWLLFVSLMRPCNLTELRDVEVSSNKQANTMSLNH